MKSEKFYTDNAESYAKTRHARLHPNVQERRAIKISHYINENDQVIDFGCGNGGVLENLNCKNKTGIELNPIFRASAIEKNISCYERLEEVPNSSFDVFLTHHSLEHVNNPVEVITHAHRVLKPNGRIIVYVPAENPRSSTFSWKPNEPNQHLYSWTSLSLGNLLSANNFEILSSKTIPIYIYKKLFPLKKNPKIYKFIGSLFACLQNRHEICAVGEKK